MLREPLPVLRGRPARRWTLLLLLPWMAAAAVARVLEYLAWLGIEYLTRLRAVVPGTCVLLRVLEYLARLAAALLRAGTTPLLRTAATTRAAMRSVHWSVAPHRAVRRLLLGRRALLRWPDSLHCGDRSPAFAGRLLNGPVAARSKLLRSWWRHTGRIFLPRLLRLVGRGRWGSRARRVGVYA